MRELKFRAWDPYTNELIHSPIVFGSTLEKYFSDIGWTWEQYTGLKDENGKEIYEGDIVTLDNEGEEIDCSIISFKEGCFRVGEGYENEAGSYLSSWRVIGNIHENPELLEEK